MPHRSYRHLSLIPAFSFRIPTAPGVGARLRPAILRLGIATAAWEFIFWRGRLRPAILRLGIATAASPPRGDASEVVQLEPRAWPDALDEKPDQENMSEV